jgi:beta-lactamase class A
MTSAIDSRVQPVTRRVRIAACAAVTGLALLGTAVAASATPSPSALGPFRSSAMKRFLSHREGNITAAVDDLSTGQTFVYRPDVREDTASIVKASILATLLHRAQVARRSLTANQRRIARGMIEASDNNDATALWNEDDGSGGVGGFLRLAGLTQTTFDPGGAWGYTRTTPLDQVRLLRTLALPSRLLSRSAQEYQLGLMSHVIPFDYWGVPAGVPAGVHVAIKNGWLPVPGLGWQINSIGDVDGFGEHYLIAVMTNGNPSEGYGIDTIAGIARIVWARLVPDIL